MLFQDSGLVNDKLVERAFNYAQAYTQSLAKEVTLNYRNSVNKSYDREIELLNLDLKDKIITPEEYEKEKAALEKQRAIDLKGPNPFAVTAALEKLFRSNSVGTALEIQSHSDNASPSLIAAALLAACARSPVDSKKIRTNFGDTIEDIVATIIDTEVYPAEHDEKTAAASADTKRVLMAGLTNRFRKAAARQELGDKVSLEPGQAEAFFKEIKLLWGADKKLDARLVTVFNQAAATLKSAYTLEVSDKGLPLLIHNSLPPPPPPKPAPKKPGFGDDGF